MGSPKPPSPKSPKLPMSNLTTLKKCPYCSSKWFWGWFCSNTSLLLYNEAAILCSLPGKNELASPPLSIDDDRMYLPISSDAKNWRQVSLACAAFRREVEEERKGKGKFGADHHPFYPFRPACWCIQMKRMFQSQYFSWFKIWAPMRDLVVSSFGHQMI